MITNVLPRFYGSQCTSDFSTSASAINLIFSDQNHGKNSQGSTLPRALNKVRYENICDAALSDVMCVTVNSL